HAPDLPLVAVADVERAVRTLSHAVGAVRCIAWASKRLCFAGEALGEHFEHAGRVPVRKRLEGHVVTGLRRAIPRAVECDKGTVVVFLRKLAARVEHEIARRPARGKAGHRQHELAASADPLTVAAVL